MDNLKEVQHAVLGIMKDIDKVCTENHITVTLYRLGKVILALHCRWQRLEKTIRYFLSQVPSIQTVIMDYLLIYLCMITCRMALWICS